MADYIEEMKEELKNYEKTKIYPNIILLGGTGCGKSSLVNNVFGVNIAKVSDIQPETQEFESFKGKDYGIYVNLIDSKGYELEDSSEDYIIRLKEKISSMEMKNEKIHIVWFCLSVAKKRIEEIDIAILEKVLEIKELKGRVFVAFTKCDEDDNKGSIVIEYKKILQTNFSNLKMYEVSNDENLKLELDNLIEESAMCLNNNDLKDSFISSQTRNLELKKRYAESAMKKYIGLAATAGAVPIPFSDSAVLIPLQLKMIAEITGIYGMRNFATISKGVVSDIVIGNTGKSIAGSLLKFIPGVGSIVGGAINASVASAITYALGKAVSEICFKNCNKILNGMETDSFDIFNSDVLVELSKSFFNEYNKKK